MGKYGREEVVTPKGQEIVLGRAERLRDSRKQGTSLSLPLAISHRLDLLAEAAEAMEATRAEVIGMLIAEAEVNPDNLEQAILRYRKARVGDVIPAQELRAPEPDLTDADNVIAISAPGPGRR